MSNRVMVYGHDKIGRAAMIVRNRYHNPGEFDTETMTRYGCFVMQRAIRASEMYGNKQIVSILDRQGTTKANQDIKFMISFV